MNKTNHTALIEAGQETRFGRNWPGKRCLAKTRRGSRCQNPAIGGRNANAHLKHGRRRRSVLAEQKQRNEQGRRIQYGVKYAR